MGTGSSETLVAAEAAPTVSAAPISSVWFKLWKTAMSSKFLMMISAIFLAILGLLTSFLPQKVLGLHGTQPDGPTILLIEMMGALYLGFAILNWTARGVLIGGIYARPLALGNFLHFAMVGVMLTREAIDHMAVPLAISALVFSIFAVGFGLVLFRPLPKT
jgi:hypothetical protein